MRYLLCFLTGNISRLQALDKIRFLSLTDKEILGEGDNTKLEIQVSRNGHIRCFSSYVFSISSVWHFGFVFL